MQSISTNNFGFAVAYLVPGFIMLWGVSVFSETIFSWLRDVPKTGPTIGGFLYLTLGALTAGMVSSTVRWMLLDSLHHCSGIGPPKWDFQKLQSNLGAYKMLEENHYRYYQFYGNTLVASLFSYLCLRPSFNLEHSIVFDSAIAILACIFYFASRDTLRKYYDRVDHMLGGRKAN